MNTAYNLPAKAPEGDVMESVIAKGDLAKLTPDERVRYYQAVCKSLGLNPLTQPLSYVTLSGRLTLYATRACTDQLRKINGVSLEVVSRRIDDDILTVHVKATTPDGRSDEDFGSVAFPSALKGEARANAVLKAITKAKRRATLSICGLGWLDETEVEAIPGARLPPHNPQTGEITESAGAEQSVYAADAAPASEPSPREVGAALLVEQLAKEAAMRGEAVFKEFYRNRTKPEQARINAIGDELRAILDRDPAADDRGPPDFTHLRSDIDPEHRRNIEAYLCGKRAKADGHQRRAIPPEYREPNATREALAWTAGWEGEPMPEFGE